VRRGCSSAPYAIGLLLALIASPAFHSLVPRRFIQLIALIALFPAARIVLHASERANLAPFAGLFVLGIGIGLGLQDLVKNFAAGLTLLFERRLHVGDVLEMPSHGIFGHVRSIGMRASVVRSWNGAEIVVPNADLVASAITNWTLSDRLCRLEVPVGVAYGTDPERVVALLLDAVRSNDGLLKDPPPQALFKGFGESSLDFVVRAWTDQYEERLSLTSELALAVHRSLREAGITIPFPQRDLHPASVSPAARAALSGVDRKE
jgi:potassium efflux system protein